MDLAATRRATRGMKREWRLHSLAIFSLAVSFVCLGAALLVVTNVHALSERWGRTARLSAYIKETTNQEDATQLKDALTRVPGVVDVRYVSSTQAHAEFSATEAKVGAGSKDELLALPVEAFPASIELSLRADITKPEVEDIVRKLKLLPIVDEVETYETWTSRLSELVQSGVVASIVFSIVVLLSVLAIVGSTIRLVLYRRRAEVEVLRLVGATDPFVRRPFLVEGGAQGALSAFFALTLLALGFLATRSRLQGTVAPFFGVDVVFLPWPMVLGMVAFGALLGMAAASFGLRRLVVV